MPIPSPTPRAAKVAARLLALVGLAAITCTQTTAEDENTPEANLRERTLTTASGRSVSAQLGRIRVPENPSKEGKGDPARAVHDRVGAETGRRRRVPGTPIS